MSQFISVFKFIPKFIRKEPSLSVHESGRHIPITALCAPNADCGWKKRCWYYINVIVKATQGWEKSREPIYRFWEYSSLDYFNFSVLRTCQSQFLQNCNRIKGVIWFWYAVSVLYNYTFSALYLVKIGKVTRQILRKNTYLYREQYSCIPYLKT